MSNVESQPSVKEFREWFTGVVEAGKDRLEGPHRLKEACVYALCSGGKSIRPMIVYYLGQSFNPEIDLSEAALSVEYFHTASLISDDLPCMDNSELRRGKPSLHRHVDEACALLASYGLITKAFEEIHRAGKMSPFENRESLCSKALGFAANRAGLDGATGGQYDDLYLQEPGIDEIMQVIERKTVGLFELAFVLGTLFGSGRAELFDLAVRAGGHYGRAFQMADDIDDRVEDADKKINIVNHLGIQKTKELIETELAGFTETLMLMGVDAPAFSFMRERLQNQLISAG